MRILVISTLSDLHEGLLPALRDAGHDLVAVVPSIKRARVRRDLTGFALFEGEPSCPGDWQRLVEGSELVLHLAYSTTHAPESESEPRHVLRADSVFQTVESIQRVEPGPMMMIVATGSSTSLDDSSDASVIRERLDRIARKVEGKHVALRFIEDGRAENVLAELAELNASEPPVPSTSPRSVDAVGSASDADGTSPECLALPLDAILNEEVPANAFDLLHRIAAEGVHIVLFTSSGMARVLKHQDSLGFCRYVIIGDGAALLDLRTREMVRTELIEPGLLEELVASARGVSPRLSMFSERGMNLISDGGIPPLEAAVEILGASENLVEGCVFDRPATRLFIQGPPTWVARVEHLFSEGWWKSGVIGLLNYGPGLLGVLAPSADRSIALQRIESLLEVPRRSAVVLVSSPLDAGMLEIYPKTWAFGPFAEVIGRHASRCVSSKKPLHELLGDFLALHVRG